MNKKTKIILFSIIGVALVLFLLAFLISGNKKYKIIFDTNGGSYIRSQEIKKVILLLNQLIQQKMVMSLYNGIMKMKNMIF